MISAEPMALGLEKTKAGTKSEEEIKTLTSQETPTHRTDTAAPRPGLFSTSSVHLRYGLEARGQAGGRAAGKATATWEKRPLPAPQLPRISVLKGPATSMRDINIPQHVSSSEYVHWIRTAAHGAAPIFCLGGSLCNAPDLLVFTPLRDALPPSRAWEPMACF